MKKILIVAHKFLPQPDDELVGYLNKNRTQEVLHIYHGFSDCPDRKSHSVWYKSGKEISHLVSQDYKHLPEPLLYFKEMIFTLVWTIKTKTTWDEAIGMDGLCTNFLLLLKMLGRVKKVNYWAIDFVPKNRFKQDWKNQLYHFINKIGYKYADEMWDLSPRMAEAREKFIDVKKDSYKKLKLVPYGMWLSRIKPITYDKCKKNTLVFMGHLLEKQGAQHVIKIIPKVIKKMPDFVFNIIGTGAYEPELKKLVEELKLEKHVKFLGKLPTLEMEKEIASSCAAIAPYDRSLDTWTYYADPGKVKTYLACGVPVLLSDVPWNTKEIISNKCGIVIDITRDFSSQIIDLMENNSKYRGNTRKYAQSYDYSTIFSSILK